MNSAESIRYPFVAASLPLLSCLLQVPKSAILGRESSHLLFFVNGSAVIEGEAMKTASLLVALVGILALVLAVIERVFHTFLFDVAPMSYLTVSATFFLLALVLIEYDRSYGLGKK